MHAFRPQDATRFLAVLHEANEVSGVLACDDFYNDAVNNDEFNVKEDLRRWKHVRVRVVGAHVGTAALHAGMVTKTP